MNSRQIIQQYAIESYAVPGSNMELRSAYIFRRHLIADAFLQWTKGRIFDTLIDIGSSTGFLTKKIKVAARHTIAVDANQRVLDAIQDPTIKTVLDELPGMESLAAYSADIVVCTDTLYYLVEDDMNKAVERISQILRCGGHFIFNDNGATDSIQKRLAKDFEFVATVSSGLRLKSKPNFDRLYWLVEARYVFLRGMFNALNDPQFDVATQLSEWRNRRLVQLCERHRWVGKLLWMSWPVRWIARQFWGSDRLLQAWCVEVRSGPAIWIFQKRQNHPEWMSPNGPQI